MNDPTRLMWEITDRNEKAKSDRLGWELRKGAKIFANPEARCPNCETWVPTQRIWLVDESSKKLLGCWRLDGSRVIADGRKVIIHPHVYHNGDVCKGDADGVSTALFSGVDNGNHYHLTENWFEQLGHICPNVEKIPCAWCGFRQFDHYCETYGEVEKCLCSQDCVGYAQAMWCWRCLSARDFYDPKTGEKHLCSKCRDEGHVCQCHLCRTHMCRDCSFMLRPEDLDSNRRCSRCRGSEPESNTGSDAYYCDHCGENEVDGEGWICDECCCRECSEPICDRSDFYCSEHLYGCTCPCDCGRRISVEGICYCCEDDCAEEESHQCACDRCGGCSNEVDEEGDICADCPHMIDDEDY